MTSIQELRRLFGPVNRPHYKTNLRHQALLRKALELFSIEELVAIFERLTGLRVVTGSASTFNVLGKIQTHYVSNDRLVCRETPAPEAVARQALLAYRRAYDVYFMKQGNVYRVRDPQALQTLQAAEQARHDWIVPYLAADPVVLNGLYSCYLGFRERRAMLPSPPPTSPVGGARPTQSPRIQVNLLTPPPTSLLHSPTRGRSPTPIPVAARGVASKKRKFLGIIDISDVVDSDDGAEVVELRRPCKKQKLSNVDSDDEVEIVSEVIDLTV
ncbi:hypothetical protein C8R43DRAFT_1131243 [Mycena crocata]|nr:hypothetical protein C8R43DRAFT_1131243 [Mycena crocata]